MFNERARNKIRIPFASISSQASDRGQQGAASKEDNILSIPDSAKSEKTQLSVISV